MIRLYLLLIISIVLLGCSNENNKQQDVTNDQKIIIQQETVKSKNIALALSSAIDQAQKNNPAGFLKIYEIAKDDVEYTAEYSEVAPDEMLYLLYSKTKLWIKLFAQVNQGELLSYLCQRGLGIPSLPKENKSENEIYYTILDNLKNIKTNNKAEIFLIKYLLQELEATGIFD